MICVFINHEQSLNFNDANFMNNVFTRLRLEPETKLSRWKIYLPYADVNNYSIATKQFAGVNELAPEQVNILF
jgi:hypothetical protein